MFWAGPQPSDTGSTSGQHTSLNTHVPQRPWPSCTAALQRHPNRAQPHQATSARPRAPSSFATATVTARHLPEQSPKALARAVAEGTCPSSRRRRLPEQSQQGTCPSSRRRRLPEQSQQEHLHEKIFLLIQVHTHTPRMARRRTQLALMFRQWGGARAGAGRRPKGASAGVSHLRRPAHSRHHPVHVTLKIVRGVPSLRQPGLFGRVRTALALARERFGFRLIHFSVQSNHLHLIAEAADRRALSRGVQGLTIRVARAVNYRVGRKGRLFADRYHARALKTPRACSLALRYVILNARKHLRAPAAPRGFVDPCSSGPWFAGFARPRELVFGAERCRAAFLRATGLSAPVVAPRIWLLGAGLKRAAPFDVDDVPSTSQ